MRPGIALRPDYDAAQLRILAKATRNAGPSRRVLALAEIYDGGSRTKAARIGGVGLQTIRDWVVKFNARGPEGLIESGGVRSACHAAVRVMSASMLARASAGVRKPRAECKRFRL